jgi:hypothetical protein
VARGQNTRALSANSDVAGGRRVLRGRSFYQLGCGGPALLPAPLTGFATQYAPSTGTTLTWTTRDECFLSSFVVERSLGGDTTAWTRLATVATRPPAAQYQYVDAQTPGGLHYYRLRLLRPDGSFDSVAPALITTEGASITASIFPNPLTGDVLRLQYPTAADGVVIFRIYDRLGRRLSTTSATLPAGLNVVPLNIASLVPGLYILRWQDAQGKTGSRRFVRY